MDLLIIYHNFDLFWYYLINLFYKIIINYFWKSSYLCSLRKNSYLYVGNSHLDDSSFYWKLIESEIQWFKYCTNRSSFGKLIGISEVGVLYCYYYFSFDQQAFKLRFGWNFNTMFLTLWRSYPTVGLMIWALDFPYEFYHNVQPLTDRWIVYKGNLWWLYKRRGAAGIREGGGQPTSPSQEKRKIIIKPNSSSSNQAIKRRLRGALKSIFFIFLSSSFYWIDYDDVFLYSFVFFGLYHGVILYVGDRCSLNQCLDILI